MNKIIVYTLAALVSLAFVGCHGRHHHHGHCHDVPPPVHHGGARVHPQPVPQQIPPPIPPPVRPRRFAH